MIIGLTGYAQSGKDTVAKVLIEKYGYTRIAFADKIREYLYEMNPIIDNVAGEPIFLKELIKRDDWEVAKKSPHVRRALQNAGVAARKVFGDTFWIYQALSDVRPQDKTVVTDVRFKNEADWIKDFGGQIWRVERDGVAAINNHISENEMDTYPVDFTIFNNGTLEELESIVTARAVNLLHEQQVDFE
jgi:hypothetical protein